jgi:hypothetical protein
MKVKITTAKAATAMAAVRLPDHPRVIRVCR